MHEAREKTRSGRPWRRLPVVAKVVAAASLALAFAVLATGYVTYRVAREAVEKEIVEAGRKTVADFARVNALEFVDSESGRSELTLRLRQLLDSGYSPRVLGAVAVDRKGARIVAMGDEPSLSVQELESLEAPARVDGAAGVITIAAPVVYDKVHLGHLAFAFEGEAVRQAGERIARRTILFVSLFIVLNALLLWLLMRRVLRPVVRLGDTAEAFARGDYGQRVAETSDEDEVGRMARSFNRMADELALHLRFTNAALVDRIRSGKATDRAQEHQLAILFGDAAGYTAWSQRHTAEQIFATLTRYYTLIGCITVRRFHGIVDKFIGDGVLIHFGLLRDQTRAHRVDQEEARAAVRTAVYSQVAMRVLSAAIEEFEGRPALRYRMGIASGKCLVGPVGAKDIMLDYSLIGTVVNLASRLEATASPGGLVIDRFTLLDVGEGFVEVVDGGLQRIKGFEQPVQVFRVRDFASAAEREAMARYLTDELFDDAFIRGVILDGAGDAARLARVREVLGRELAVTPALPVG